MGFEVQVQRSQRIPIQRLYHAICTGVRYGKRWMTNAASRIHPSESNSIKPHHTIPRHTTPYPPQPYHTLPYHTVPIHTIAYNTIPYHTIPISHPHHTIPIPITPYPSLPQHTRQGWIPSASSSVLHPSLPAPINPSIMTRDAASLTKGRAHFWPTL